MLLRNSISNAKKFFKKSLQNLRNFFSSGSYQRMSKTSPYNNPCSYSHLLTTDMNVQTSFNAKDLDTFYNDFNDSWDAVDEGKAKKRNKKKRMPPSSSPAKEEKKELNGSSMKFSKAIPAKNNQIKRREDYNYNHKTKVKGSQGGGKRWQQNSSRDEGRSCLVAQKLKEVEMMDISNVHHVLDIEEFLHYYSRLTCPAYLDIVDNFFMDMYAEFFAPPGSQCKFNAN
ncbi:hypothetical protein P3X46_007756 [Hevea brasiliensis]|uniref:OVATE domain-containing protein n=1 Tax=Hevea brasiliensis TaxID=3981 RepID=A0ABQ9MUI7_HEVBR|nr:hypothetical protein P3X46_007756 [Hevea brasiliensis]